VSIAGTLTPILFNAVRTGNADGAFNVNTGAYVAPTIGSYNFSTSVVILQTAAVVVAVSVGLLVNGVPTNIAAQSVPGIAGQPVSVSFSSVLRLNAGDIVQVGATTTGALVFGSAVAPSASYTSFQGISLF